MSPPLAPLPHRVRRLRWQARAAGAAEALALRQRLVSGQERLQQALGEALDGLDDGGWLQLARVELQLDPSWLEAPADALVQHLRAQLAPQLHGLRRSAAAAGPGGAAPAGEAAADTVALLPARALLDYLATGHLPWALGGLAPEALRPRLQAAAEALAQDGLVWRAAPPPTDPTLLLGWWQRWWALWPGPAREAWWQAQQAVAAATAAVHEGSTPSPAALARWLAQPSVPPARRGPLQALWLAWHSAGPGGGVAAGPSAVAPTTPSIAALAQALWPEGFAGTPTAPDRPRNAPPPAAPPPGVDTAPTARPVARAVQPRAEPGWMVPLAGLVLLHPWVPALLRACDVPTPARPDQAWDPLALARAGGLLRALAQAPEAPAEDGEWALPVVKLLLGCPPDLGWPLPLCPPTPQEQAEVQALLAAAIDHWGALGRTGVDSLRTSFLQRPGLLSRQGEGWLLRPLPEAFDLLLSRLPWGLAWIRLPWMAQPLQVDWSAP